MAIRPHFNGAMNLNPDARSAGGGGQELSDWEKAGRRGPRPAGKKGSGKRWGRRLIIVGGVIVVLLIAVVLLLPTIVSGMAPGRIESAAGDSIKGKVKVDQVSLGWFSPTMIGPVEVFDPEGKSAAKVTVSTKTTLWRIVSERWWSLKVLDAGEVELSGQLDLIRDLATGKTNLERALEPKVAAGKSATGQKSGSGSGSSSGSSSGGPEKISGALKITKFSATVRDRAADGTLSEAVGVQSLAGLIKGEYIASPMSASVSADVSGSAVGPGAGAEPVMLVIDAKLKPKASASAGASGLATLDSAKVNMNIVNAPMGLVDAIATQGGALVKGVGPRADVAVVANYGAQVGGAQTGGAQAGDVQVDLKSEGVNGSMGLTLRDGVLKASEPGEATKANTLTVASTDFVGLLPAMRPQLEQIAQKVKLSKSPSIELRLEKLSVPLPASLLGAPAGSANADMSQTDWRGSGMVLVLSISGMDGQVALDDGVRGSGAAGNWKSFRVEPMSVRVDASDLAKAVNVAGSTSATIDGSPAGRIELSALASGLLDQQGRIRAMNKNAGLADEVQAKLNIRGVSTALVQPIVAGLKLPVDLGRDVGPTLDVVVDASADVKGLDAQGTGKDLPPIAYAIDVTSSNVKLAGAGTLKAGVIALGEKGLVLNVKSAGPMLSRVLTSKGMDQTLKVGGVGAIDVNVTRFSVPMDKLKGAEALAAIKSDITIKIDGLEVTPMMVGASGGAGASAQPIEIRTLSTQVKLDGAKPPVMEIRSAMAHAGTPWDLKASLTLDGIVGGKLPASETGAGQIISFKPTGKIEVVNLPRSVLNLLPSTSAYGTSALVGDDMMTQISRAVRESIGTGMSLVVTLAPKDKSLVTTADLTTQGGGASAQASAQLLQDAIKLDALNLSLAMDPAKVNPVLAAAGGASSRSNPATPMQLGGPFALALKSTAPVNVPLKKGTFEPDFAKAGEAAVTLVSDRDIMMSHVPAGNDANGQARLLSVRVKQLGGDVKVPLAGLAPNQQGAQRLSAKFKALATGGLEGSGAAADRTLADINVNASASMDGKSPDATITLNDIDSGFADALAGKPGLVSGALGEKSAVVIRAQPSGKDATAIALELTAPRVSEAKLYFTMDDRKLAINKSSTILWRPDASFLNATLFAPPAAASGVQRTSPPMTVSQISPVTITISKLAIAMSKGDGAGGAAGANQPVVGPMLPGVFELDCGVTASSVALNVPSSEANGGKPQTLTLEGLSVAVRHAQGTAQDPAGEIQADLAIARVSGAGAEATSNQRSGAKVQIGRLADAQGVINAGNAIVNLDANLASFPTPVIDVFAKQNGLLAELMGATVNLEATGRNVSTGGGDASKASGVLAMNLVSPRASAKLKGEVKGGAFVLTEPLTVQVTQIRPQLLHLMSGSIPIIESLEKKPEDKPAAIDSPVFSIPLDGDVRKLNGEVRIDPGVARFTTGSIWGEIVEALGGKSSGAIGQRIEPFVVKAVNGVLTYEQFKLPIGQFNLETKGTVDLVQRQINIVTYAPLSSLTGNALKSLNSGIAGKLGVLDKNTLVPIVTKGSLDNPKTEIDFGLFLKERGDALTKDPGKIIDNVLNDLLGGKKDGAQPPTPAPKPKPK